MQVNSLQGGPVVRIPGQETTSAPETMLDAAEAFMATLKAAEVEGAAALSGNGDPHRLVMALTESKLAVEATVAVRDRVVEAYQELLRMPV